MFKDDGNIEMSTIEFEAKKGDSEAREKDEMVQEEAMKATGIKYKERESWGSQLEFLFSCLSFAVGLGNVWRFPYLCYRNGGGAFLIPYVLNLVFTGLPLFFFELSLGQYARSSPIALWSICPLFKGIGISMLVIVTGIGLYYNIVIAWIIFYLGAIISNIASGSLPWTSCDNWWNTIDCVETNSSLSEFNVVNESHNDYKIKAVEEFFNDNMLQITSGIEQIGGLRWELVACLLGAWSIVYLALLRGVRSLGKVVYFTALFPYVILAILFVRGLTLPGAALGIRYYLYPDFEKLKEIQVWADAAMQIFFSLGPCWGSLITLATYNKFNNNTLRDAIIVSFANCLTSFLTGFVVFSFIGFMAQQLERTIDEVTVSGPGLAFIVYPEAVAMLPMSPLWAILFFLMLLTLGVGTQLTIMETITRTIVDAWPGHISHRYVLTFACGVMFIMGLPMITDNGMYVFQLMDNHVGTFPALMTGLVEILVVAWIYGAERFLEDIRRMIGWTGKEPWYIVHRVYWSLMWRLVTPLLLLVILTASMVGYTPMMYGGYVYPTWANIVGWLVSGVSVIWIPLISLIILVTRKQGIRQLLQPTEEWRWGEMQFNK